MEAKQAMKRPCLRCQTPFDPPDGYPGDGLCGVCDRDSRGESAFSKEAIVLVNTQAHEVNSAIMADLTRKHQEAAKTVLMWLASEHRSPLLGSEPPDA